MPLSLSSSIDRQGTPSLSLFPDRKDDDRRRGPSNALCALGVESAEERRKRRKTRRENKPLLLSARCPPPFDFFLLLLNIKSHRRCLSSPQKLKQTNKSSSRAEQLRERCSIRRSSCPSLSAGLLSTQRAHACLLQRAVRPVLEEPRSAAAAIAVGVFEKLGRRRRRDAARRCRLGPPRPRSGRSLVVD